MTTKQIENRIKKLRDLEAQAKELDKQILAVKSEIQNEMQDAETLETPMFIVKWSTFIQNRFDTTRFKAENSALYNAYVVGKETRRFSYTAR